MKKQFERKWRDKREPDFEDINAFREELYEWIYESPSDWSVDSVAEYEAQVYYRYLSSGYDSMWALDSLLKGGAEVEDDSCLRSNFLADLFVPYHVFDFSVRIVYNSGNWSIDIGDDRGYNCKEFETFEGMIEYAIGHIVDRYRSIEIPVENIVESQQRQI